MKSYAAPQYDPSLSNERRVLTDRMRMAFKRARAVVEMLTGDHRHHVDSPSEARYT